MLDDLAEMGYVVAELASWVGPTSAERAQAEVQPGGQVVAQPGKAGLQQVGGEVAG